jgi:hypothetical protein
MAALLAPGALAMRPGKEVPLKGDFAGVGAEFSGNFSHLGRFEGLITGAEPTTAEWTAANGDTVTNQTTSFVIDFAGGTFPVFPYEQTLEITGGTGRFAGAAGSATVTGNIDLSNPDVPVYDGHLEGTISQPGPRN